MSANPLKQLAGQTAVYGVPTIIGRFLNYLLVPLYTNIFFPEQYGAVTEIYSYIAFLLIILTYGMETAYFRYSNSDRPERSVFSTIMISIFSTSAIFMLFILMFRENLAELIKHANHSEYIVYLAMIVVFDAISAIPLAKLRADNKPRRFSVIKLTNIGIIIGINLFLLLLCPWLVKNDVGIFAEIVSTFYSGEPKVSYIFLANAIGSGVQVLMLIPQMMKINKQLSMKLWREMIIYALPLLIFGLAGIMNEALDKILLKYMLPEEVAMRNVGIYGACYKISILMTLFIQAYRYAAEPFFFAKAKYKNATELYSTMMNYFIIVGSIIFLGTMLYLDIIIHFIDEKYWIGRDVIPILLLANLFLGIYYNLSIWYKLTNQTKFGAYLSLIGAAITVALNIYWIPRIGYMGSAWATFACYSSMMVLSYFLGKKYYPVNYNLKKAFGYIGAVVAIFLVADKLDIQNTVLKWVIHSLFFLSFLFTVFMVERKSLYQIIYDEPA